MVVDDPANEWMLQPQQTELILRELASRGELTRALMVVPDGVYAWLRQNVLPLVRAFQIAGRRFGKTVGHPGEQVLSGTASCSAISSSSSFGDQTMLLPIRRQRLEVNSCMAISFDGANLGPGIRHNYIT